GPTKIQLALVLVAGQTTPLIVNLQGARLAASVDANGCTSGRIGGGVTATEINGSIIPAIATELNRRIAADSGCPAHCTDATNMSILMEFDKSPMDGTISADEVRNDTLIKGFLKPDVDLLDASGQPGKDGVAESLSIAVGFTCKKAVFTE